MFMITNVFIKEIKKTPSTCYTDIDLVYIYIFFNPSKS